MFELKLLVYQNNYSFFLEENYHIPAAVQQFGAPAFFDNTKETHNPVIDYFPIRLSLCGGLVRKIQLKIKHANYPIEYF